MQKTERIESCDMADRKVISWHKIYIEEDKELYVGANDKAMIFLYLTCIINIIIMKGQN